MEGKSFIFGDSEPYDMKEDSIFAEAYRMWNRFQTDRAFSYQDIPLELQKGSIDVLLALRIGTEIREIEDIERR